MRSIVFEKNEITKEMPYLSSGRTQQRERNHIFIDSFSRDMQFNISEQLNIVFFFSGNKKLSQRLLDDQKLGTVKYLEIVTVHQHGPNKKKLKKKQTFKDTFKNFSLVS